MRHDANTISDQVPLPWGAAAAAYIRVALNSADGLPILEEALQAAAAGGGTHNREAVLNATRFAAARNLGTRMRDEGRHGQCELVPSLLAVRAGERLSVADREHLARHIGKCGCCAELEKRAGAAEAAFAALAAEAEPQALRPLEGAPAIPLDGLVARTRPRATNGALDGTSHIPPEPVDKPPGPPFITPRRSVVPQLEAKGLVPQVAPEAAAPVKREADTLVEPAVEQPEPAAWEEPKDVSWDEPEGAPDENAPAAQAERPAGGQRRRLTLALAALLMAGGAAMGASFVLGDSETATLDAPDAEVRPPAPPVERSVAPREAEPSVVAKPAKKNGKPARTAERERQEPPAGRKLAAPAPAPLVRPGTIRRPVRTQPAPRVSRPTQQSPTPTQPTDSKQPSNPDTGDPAPIPTPPSSDPGRQPYATPTQSSPQ